MPVPVPVPVPVAALYVQGTGAYAALPGVSPWSLDGPAPRDARAYAGPSPVVAHPPCAAWGRYAKPTAGSTARGPLRGEDGGCFLAALRAVLEYGGVLEHPRDSAAWAHHTLPAPPSGGGWREIYAGVFTCAVEQGHYGHAARKPTWLLYAGPRPFDLVWGPSPDVQRVGSGRRGVLECLSKRQRAATPAPFAAVLVALARHARADKHLDIFR